MFRAAKYVYSASKLIVQSLCEIVMCLTPQKVLNLSFFIIAKPEIKAAMS